MSNKNTKNILRSKRQARIRARITGTNERPRISVYRSNQTIYAQIINDETGNTLAHANGGEIKLDKKSLKDGELTGIKKAFEVGKLLSERAKEKKIETAVFDRGGYKYHGQIKALADGAREGGLKF